MILRDLWNKCMSSVIRMAYFTRIILRIATSVPATRRYRYTPLLT